MVDAFLQTQGDPRPGERHFDQQRATDQRRHGDAGDGQHREQGIGQGVPKHHLGLRQSAAAGRFHVIGTQAAIEIQAQGIGEHTAQQQPQRAGWEHQVAQASLQRAPISAEQAVGNQKAASLGRHHPRGKTPAHRQPAEHHGEQKLGQHRHPERR